MKLFLPRNNCAASLLESSKTCRHTSDDASTFNLSLLNSFYDLNKMQCKLRSVVSDMFLKVKMVSNKK